MTTLPDASSWRAWGIEPEWSTTLDVPSTDGATFRWHVLDTGTPDDARSTIVCVHGNPTWAYAWATLLRRFAPFHRVIAVDQLGMGFSERTPLRRYATRVADLGDVIDALDIDPSIPLILAAHDWGGAIAMGWAVDHPERLAGLVLCNTGIAVPAGRKAPGIIRLAASKPLRDVVCRRTSIFVDGTARLSGSRLSATQRAAFRAPYRRAADRTAIADFVGDIPLREPHPSAAALDDVARRLGTVTAPVLLAWGASDPVFDDDFAADLADRFENVTQQRFADANHLVMAEADIAGAVNAWLVDVLDAHASSEADTSPFDGPSESPSVLPSESSESLAPAASAPLWSAVNARAASTPSAVALVDGATGDSITFAALAARVDGMARELRERGVRPGDRVAMLTPPGIDLIAAVYAVWRAGGVTVIADRGLGLKGLGAAVRSARAAWTIGPRQARVAAGVLRWAPRSTAVDIDDLVASAARHGGAAATPAERLQPLDEPAPSDLAAVLFTSGATGPAKGVRYTHGQLAGQREALRRAYRITDDDRLVAAFAPFALYGPALGIPTGLPDCDVTAPGSLTAAALDAACAALGATMVFASPAALANVVATAGSASTPAMATVRLLMSAGAPVPAETLVAVSKLAPAASLRTPYGMTEALPVADIELDAILEADAARPVAGVCVGRPVEGAEVRIAELGFDALAGVPAELPRGTTGEILVRAGWVSAGYLGLATVERHARPGDGWHRSGDVGHVDDDGRLWVEGRAVHVIDATGGPITSVPVERCIERGGIGEVTPGRVAAVGVGPEGIQQLVVVVESAVDEPGLAPASLAESIRRRVEHPVAAVLVTDRLPVDIRHNAKIDRQAVAAWATHVLAGGRVGKRFGR